MNSSTAGRSRPSASDGSGLPSSAKRIKCDNDHDIGHPIEDDASAKRKLRKAGFNPESVSEPALARGVRNFLSRYSLITPMIYFSYTGDLPMCRYLYLNGAKGDVTKTCSRGYWFPMLSAARNGKSDVCKWLYEHGAAKDIRRRSEGSSHHGIPATSPLTSAGSFHHKQVCQWLILKGALHSNPGGEFDERLAFHEVLREEDDYSLKSWPQEAISCYEAFHVFLLGTLPAPAADRRATLKLALTRKLQSEKAARILLENAPPEEHSSLLKELLPLRILNGFPGILETVADFLGVIKSRRERQILRDVAEFVENSRDD